MRKSLLLTAVLAVIALLLPVSAFASDSSEEKSGKVDAQGIIFDHLGDGYGWEVPDRR